MEDHEKLENIIYQLQQLKQQREPLNDDFPRLSDQENKLLEDLATTTNQTKKEVLRKALALINIAISSEEQGANLAIIKDGKVMTEITGFSTSAE
ncbi:MAG: hypothetical protein QNJ42_20310 [Crocosphaera sp.]|nr:hypothetical protein [Crocosphaera sp.]